MFFFCLFSFVIDLNEMMFRAFVFFTINHYFVVFVNYSLI